MKKKLLSFAILAIPSSTRSLQLSRFRSPAERTDKDIHDKRTFWIIDWIGHGADRQASLLPHWLWKRRKEYSYGLFKITKKRFHVFLAWILKKKVIRVATKYKFSLKKPKTAYKGLFFGERANTPLAIAKALRRSLPASGPYLRVLS